MVQDGLGDPRLGTEQIGEPSGRSGTDQGSLEEDRDRLEDPRGGPGRALSPSEQVRDRSGTYPEERDGSGDPLCFEGQVGGYRTGWGTLEEVRDGLVLPR